MKPFVVSIVGPSASGKSQLAKRTAAALGEGVSCRIPTDYFFIPRQTDQPLPDFLRQPLQYDWPMIVQLIVQPIGTAVSTPDADFTGFRRRADSGGLPFTIRPVMIVDAMAAFPGADLLVRLDVPDVVRRERLRERDARWGTEVLANWDHLTVTWHAALEEMHVPDVTLDGERPLEVNAGALVEEIRLRLPGTVKPADPPAGAGDRPVSAVIGWGKKGIPLTVLFADGPVRAHRRVPDASIDLFPRLAWLEMRDIRRNTGSIAYVSERMRMSSPPWTAGATA